MNKELYGNEYQIPEKILLHIKKFVTQYPNNNGVKRGKNLLKNKIISYPSLKRFKNFYDNFNGEDKIQYELSGGDLMKDFVDNKLRQERKTVEIYNKNTSDIHLNNKSNIERLTNVNESVENIKHTSVGIILNKLNRVLLLKRSAFENQWQPNMWCLPGGNVDLKESYKDAIIREIKEETNLDVDFFIGSFSKNVDNIMEHVYIIKYNGYDDDVELNFEHSGYGWFTLSEIKFLNTVPNLNEYIIEGINIFLK